MRIEPLRPELAASLGRFLDALDEAGDEPFFHPHPLTPAAARDVCGRVGLDVHVAALDVDEIVGYGMLRGWDEGHDVPSLGVAVHPRHRGRRIGRALMKYLHATAWQRGAQRIRLTVDPGNAAAIRLYRGLGYELMPQDGVLVGFLLLSATESKKGPVASVAVGDLG